MTKQISVCLSLYATLFSVIFSSGCGLPDRQALMQDKYPYYSQDIKQAIDGGYIVERMDKEQVYLALGSTACKSSHTYKGRTLEVWQYEPEPFTGRPWAGTYGCMRASQRVTFEDGRVVKWDNMPF